MSFSRRLNEGLVPSGNNGGRHPSKAQITRAMKTLFGTDWGAHCGGGGRGRIGGTAFVEEYQFLVFAENVS